MGVGLHLKRFELTLGSQMGDGPADSGQVISLPQGGGALHGIGEKFAADLHTGTGNLSVPLALPHGRLQPELTLSYSSGNGNGPFGLGWALGVPGVSRRTAKGVPRYDDADDVFVLSGVEDLIPVAGGPADAQAYRPRTEGLFARIDHFVGNGANHWRVRARDGLVSFYGTPRPEGAPPGWEDPAVVADPADRQRILAWRLTHTEDPFGNRIDFSYERDLVRVDGPHFWDQLYLSAIRYVDYGDPADPEFLVSVKFVYEPRPDPFSDHRGGFEVRTVRRCTRIDIATHPDGDDIPVRSYHLAYEDGAANHVSLLSEIRLEGRDGEKSEWLPPLEFGYTRFDQARRDLVTVSGVEMPPSSLAAPDYTLVDLPGNGLPGVLALDDAPRYWRNAGAATLDLPRPFDEAPAGLRLSDAGVQVVDADGDGRADLLVTQAPLSGYFPIRADGAFERYPVAPSFDLKDPQVRLVDLDGDGVTDAIRSGTRFDCFFNDPSRGWDATRRVPRRSQEEFPDVDFADPRVKWADMTGDGLQDVVLVHDGCIDYWPSLGRGDFGSRVTMRSSPRLPYGYDVRRVLVGDVDGDGAADVVYVDDTHVTLWINQAGNGFAGAIEIEGTPPVADVDAIRLVDMLGTGVSGVLWSADGGGATPARMFFLDFTGGLKPYLLNMSDNHIGARTRVEYAPSTQFYVDDEQRPETRWRTSLPFPVQVVARVEAIDQVSGGKLVTRYRYHHGYWDGREREFRGFGRVDQIDSETFEDYHAADGAFAPVAPEAFAPPTETRTWFHLGDVADDELDLTPEYWRGDPAALIRDASTVALLGQLPLKDRREALRTLRGSVLRTELYALDGSVLNERPYTVTERISALREESAPGPAEDGRRRIFFPHATGERTTQWERGDEPLTRFTFHGAYDGYGQPRSSIMIAAPRSAGEPHLATAVRTAYAHRDDDDRYIVDRVARETTYELVNNGSMSVEGLRAAELRAATGIDPTHWPVIAQTLCYYDGDPFVGLAAGTLGDQGALARREQLVLTETLLDGVPPYLVRDGPPPWTEEYPQGFRERMPTLAGYVFHEGSQDEQRGYYAAVERRQYGLTGLVTATRDALDHETKIAYDLYDLLPIAVTDPAGLLTTAIPDHRVLQPRQVTDVNGNRSLFEFTPLGLLEAATLMGREDEAVGDTPGEPSTRLVYEFHDFAITPQPIAVRTVRRIHHATDTDVALPQRDETIESVEYSDGFGRLLQARAQAEDLVFGDPTSGASSLPVDQTLAVEDAVGKLLDPAAGPRVVVSGWQVYDNKGRVVERYEPFLSTGWDFAASTEAERGVKATLRYDPLGRVIATLYADGSEQRVVHGVVADVSDPSTVVPTPWEAYTYDVNDNAGRTHPVESVEYATHWDTPSSVVVDALGRTVRSVVRAGPAQTEAFHTVSTYDARGNLLGVTDELGRRALAYVYDLANHRLRVESADAGIRSTMFDARGDVVESRDSKGALALHAHDALGRPIRVWARDDSASTPTLRGVLEYGDNGDPDQPWADRAAAGAAGRLGRLYRHFDEAGQVTFETYDLAGRVLEKVRRVIRDDVILGAFEPPPSNWAMQAFRVDWEPPVGRDLDDYATTLLDPDELRLSSTFDALGHPTIVRYPRDVDGARRELKVEYNLAGALERVTFGGELVVDRIAYDAHGRRTLAVYGNGIMTRHAYDPKTLRLRRIRSERCGVIAGNTYHATAPSAPLQDLAYNYDLAGNLLRIIDRTPGCGVFGNPDQLGAEPALAALLASGDALIRRFSYDPLYRLTAASGRECKEVPAPRPWSDDPRCGFNSGNHGTPDQDNAPHMSALYTERYDYDPTGNLLTLKHGQASTSPWVRRFGMGGLTPAGWNTAWPMHTAPDTSWPNPPSNQLTHVGDNDLLVSQTHVFDPNGNLIRETTSRHFEWDHSDRMRVFATQVEGSEPSVYAFYLYDAAGARVKKIVRKVGQVETTTNIGGVFDRYRSATVSGERVTDTLWAGTRESALASFRVGPPLDDDESPATKFRLTDHLGSTSVTIDLAGLWLNREEFTPYGETTFGSFAHKAYRFCGRERDEESGLARHDARYLAPWLLRWVSCDPAGPSGGTNLYTYAACNPVNRVDRTGLGDEPAPPDLNAAEPNRTSADPAENLSGADPDAGSISSSSVFAQWSRELSEAQAAEAEDRRVGHQLLSGTYRSTAKMRPVVGPQSWTAEGEAEYWRQRGGELDVRSAADEFAAGFTCGAVLGPECGEESPGATIGRVVGGLHPGSAVRDIAYGLRQVSAGNALQGAVVIGTGLIGLIPELGGEAGLGIKASLRLGKAESAAVRDAIGAGSKMTAQEIGKAAETSAAWALTAEGHEVLGAIQDASNRGIDLVTSYEGRYYVWEIKGNTARLSTIQRSAEEFVATRVYNAAIGNPGAFDVASQQLAQKVWGALAEGRVTYGSFRVRFSL
jgi:RHS repeat-associated protein